MKYLLALYIRIPTYTNLNGFISQVVSFFTTSHLMMLPVLI